jgi:2-polyprenyl-3-methyl-5-hydroxy-6-metoxy-1,4-benzoquinol methylase
MIADRLQTMRIAAVPDGVVERLGLLLNKLPTPIGEAMYSMPVARSLQVAQRTGILGALAEGPRDPAELAEHLGLQATGTARVLDVIASLGHVKQLPDGRYEMTASGRPWLDPRSDTYLGDFLADTAHYWDWYAGLEDLVRDGTHVELHGKGPDDPYWRSYIRGQYQLARLSSAEVAKAIPLARGAHSVLDVAGAHGEFSMALCRRHEGLRATIVDLPGSAKVGEEIVAEAGMSDRVRHLVGDMFEVDYDGHYDGALCFNIIHHLSPEQATALFHRIRAVLRPGAPLAVLDLYDRPAGQRANLASVLGLFFHLTSGADTYTVDEVSRWMGESGYGKVEAKSFRTLPDLRLLIAKAV